MPLVVESQLPLRVVLEVRIMQYSGLSATLQGTPKLYTTSVKLHTNTERSYRLHGPCLQRKQTRAAAVQKSQQLVERVPASSVAQEVRFSYFAQCCLFFLARITVQCYVAFVALPCAHLRYRSCNSNICHIVCHIVGNLTHLLMSCLTVVACWITGSWSC